VLVILVLLLWSLEELLQSLTVVGSTWKNVEEYIEGFRVPAGGKK
jgi:hypothetical protein